MLTRRSLCAGWLAAVLLLGAFEWHPVGEVSDSLLPRGGEIYFPGASHPRQPVHFEAADPSQRPFCPVCLSHLQTSGAHLRAAAAVAQSTLQTAVVWVFAPAVASRSRRPGSARAPPFFS